jgi:arylsulfatase A
MLRLFTLVLLLLMPIASQASDVPASQNPNIVVILTDDLGWGTVGCYGANPELVQTPSIDRLAKEGRRFTDANTTSSVCSPTRYALMTGRYCWRTSLISEVLGVHSPLHIETNRITIASMLQGQGYQCAAVGKWHLGYGSADRCDYTKELKPGPLEIGFDYHFGVPSNHGDITGVYVENHWVSGLNQQSPTTPSPPYETMQQRKGGEGSSLDLNAPKRIDDEVMSTLTDKAVNWIEQQSPDKPFFLYFTPVAVHNPITPSKQTAGKSKGGPFCDFVSDLDISVGRVLESLDKKGFTQNTLVLFSSDNGGVNKPSLKNKTGEETPQNMASNAGLKPNGSFRGGKHDVWEGGFRVPYLIRWPGKVPASSVCDETISIVDTLASIAKITGATLPKAEEGDEDSFDVSKAWLGQEYPGSLRPDLIVHSADGNFAIRKEGWKWIEGIPADNVRPASKKARAEQMTPMLYRLADDLAETANVASAHATVAQEMETLLTRYRDGGYSRELPPIKPKTIPQAATLPPLVNAKTLDFAGFRKGQWSVRGDALFCTADTKGSPMTGPIEMRDGILDFKVLLGDANRHSLRIQTAGNPQSYRIVLSKKQLEVALNPVAGDVAGKATPIGSLRMQFKSNLWQPMRLTFLGDVLTVQCAGSELVVKHAVFGEPKKQLNFIAFEGEVGIKQAQVVSLD